MNISRKNVLGISGAMVAVLTMAHSGNLSAQASGSDLPRPSAETVSAARAQGVDLGRLPSSPGLHIVALDDSPFVGPVAQRIREEIAQQARAGSYTSGSGEVPDLRLATHGAQSTLASTSLLSKRYHSLADILPHLRYAPISLGGTLLESHPMVEATTAGGVTDGRWGGVTRSWDVAGLGFVRLDESEYRETGGSISAVTTMRGTACLQAVPVADLP